MYCVRDINHKILAFMTPRPYDKPMGRKAFQRKDRFYKKAKDEGYVARSAYKIQEYHQKYKIFAPGSTVIDLGCAPGGWLQVAQKLMKDKGKLVGIDLLDVKIGLSPQTTYIKGDFLDPANQQKILDEVGDVDWVLSDMSANLSGIKFKDQMQNFELLQSAFELAKNVLKSGGGFLFKFFPSADIDEWKAELRTHFEKVSQSKPDATRGSSNESYMICLGFKKETLSPESDTPAP